MMTKLLAQLGESNPQLFRELKGRLKPRPVVIASLISIVGQFLVYLFYQGQLPIRAGEYSRYCTGSSPYSEQYHYHYQNGYCIKDLLGNIVIFHQLWWLDVFIGLSIIGIFGFLVVGTYMLITDLAGEERRGTLNFIRLSPQTAKNIFIGKILGVPILVYLVGILALPFHLFAGLSAHIPLHLILVFYGVLIASCALFYNGALLFALVSGGLGGFQAWLGSGALLIFLFTMTSVVTSNAFPSETPLDWLILFYPGTVLPYLVNATFLNPETVNYLKFEEFKDLLWYGQALWSNPWTGIGFILLNFGWWTYWITRSLKRRFHNPLATALSKLQSYWISGSFAVLGLGFILQTANDYELNANFTLFYVLLVILSLLLIAGLSPERQTLQDWARYRHQEISTRNLLKDLILGDKSPSTVAMMINLGIVGLYLTPAILLSPLEEYTPQTFAGLWLGINMMLIYALVAQRILLIKSSKRFIVAASAITCLIIIPIFCLGFLSIEPSEAPLLWFFSVIPIAATEYGTATMVFFSILGQWLTVAVLGFSLTKQLHRAGESNFKALMTGQPTS